MERLYCHIFFKPSLFLFFFIIFALWILFKVQKRTRRNKGEGQSHAGQQNLGPNNQLMVYIHL